MAKVLELTTKNFKDTIEKNDFVIIDFWAPWCEPCKNFTPIFEKAAEANKDIDRQLVRWWSSRRVLRRSGVHDMC